tara:strand:+ start:2732 stop:3157 length:426 start_codon:yes stop_codon:yes gene_type:complete
MALNETEVLVMQTIIMKLNEAESLAWVRSHLPKKKKPIDRSTYYRLKGKIIASADKRKFELQKKGLWEQHLERIDQLETTLKFSWQNYHREQDISKKQRILDSITNMQPLLSAYYAASQEVIERDVQKDIQITGHLSDISN